MTKRDFFRLILKLFGLYSLILTVFSFIPSNIGYIMYDFNYTAIVWIAGMTAFVLFIFLGLIRNTDKIIDWLKIDRGFDEDRIEFGNFNAQGIAKLALIIIGGFLILDYLPDFIQYFYLAFKEKVSTNSLNEFESIAFGTQLDYFQWTVAGINIIMGYILLTQYQRIGVWLTRKTQ